MSNAPRFHWREIEATDYRVYMANLRRIGCPEETLRDIISADVHALFQRKRDSVHSAKGSTSHDLNLITEEHQVLAALEIPIRPEVAHSNTNTIENQTAASEVGPIAEATPQLIAIPSQLQELSSRRSEILSSLGAREPSMTELKELKSLENTKAQFLNEALTPEERTAFEPEHWETVAALKDDLNGIEVTEEELQSLLRARTQLDAALAGSSGEGEVYDVRSIDQEVERILGHDRFVRFSRITQP